MSLDSSGPDNRVSSLLPPRDRWSSAAWTVAGALSWWTFLALPYLAAFGDANGWYLALGVGLAVAYGIRFSGLPANRVPGMIPPATLLPIGSALAGYLVGPSRWTLFMASAGLFATLAATMLNARWRRSLAIREPAWPRNLIPTDTALLSLAIGSVVVHLASIRLMPDLDSAVRERLRLAHVAVLGILILLFAWTRLFRPFFELCVEAVVGRNYRLVTVGDVDRVPACGPVVVIANHACRWDPLFLAKAMPRPVTPMMTSIFYDRWYIKPLVKYVFGTIRVPDSRARKDAPEIQDAIRSLDEGKCLMIFPEGYLRRKEEVPLRRFGRGIWEILKARPDTPVVCCWIEGAWGSYSSHWNGPPTVNKPKEGRRTITIGIAEPMVLPTESIEHHLATRIHLMNEVSAARRHVGLEPLPAFELPARDDETEQPS